VLSLEGAEPVIAGDGAAALAFLREGCADLVVLDLSLPGISGWDVLETARRETMTCPFVILTASAGQASRERALDMGAIEYLVKPIGARELVSALERYLGPASEWGR
jgi:DNA-binding response OmpR family regulator